MKHLLLGRQRPEEVEGAARVRLGDGWGWRTVPHCNVYTRGRSFGDLRGVDTSAVAQSLLVAKIVTIPLSLELAVVELP